MPKSIAPQPGPLSVCFLSQQIHTDAVSPAIHSVFIHTDIKLLFVDFSLTLDLPSWADVENQHTGLSNSSCSWILGLLEDKGTSGLYSEHPTLHTVYP